MTKTSSNAKIIENIDENMDYDVVIAGAGLAGLTTAVALSAIKLRVALIAPRQKEADGRTTALLSHSIDYLDHLGLWEIAQQNAAKMAQMRIIDNTDRLFRAPEITFKAREIDLDAFGYNILNTDLALALTKKLEERTNFTRIEAKVLSASQNENYGNITLDNGQQLQTSLIVGADGRNSQIRKSARSGRGIPTRQNDHNQCAIVLNFTHSLPHHDTSTEFHTPQGPFTIVPLESRLSSLVWVVNPARVNAIISMPPHLLEAEIERQMHSILGQVKLASKIQKFPLTSMKADRLGEGRIVLVGDAAHSFPPIGAQGFNLGIRDIESLSQIIGPDATPNYLARQANSISRTYHNKRNADVITRSLSVDALNQSLLTHFVPLQILRSAGLHALNTITPLRRMMMREGVSPGLGLRQMFKGRMFKDLTNVARHMRPSS